MGPEEDERLVCVWAGVTRQFVNGVGYDYAWFDLHSVVCFIRKSRMIILISSKTVDIKQLVDII